MVDKMLGSMKMNSNLEWSQNVAIYEQGKKKLSPKKKKKKKELRLPIESVPYLVVYLFCATIHFSVLQANAHEYPKIGQREPKT